MNLKHVCGGFNEKTIVTAVVCGVMFLAAIGCFGMFNGPMGYDETMSATYGMHFLNFKEYCGGAIPGDYWSDDVHLNAQGYERWGQAVYDRLILLGII